jgi:hypothetical protein
VQLNDRLRYDLQTGDRGYIAINVSKLDK